MSRWSMSALLVATTVGVSCIGFAIGTQSATAKTPDGATPAEEDVCTDAGLTGRAWGLCNAYCEAMDCDSDDPQASETACGRVLENWERHADGLTMPCEQTECPCWSSSEDVASVHASNSPPTFGSPRYRVCSRNEDDSVIAVTDVVSRTLITSFVSPTDASCATELRPRGGEVLPILGGNDLTADEVQQCSQILQGLCQ
jgi:hypothetical protein